jgi:hypothetical protein
MSIRMMESEEFLEQIHCQLASSGMHMDKEALRKHLFIPGEERLELIHWTLSEMDITIKNHGNVFFLC